MKALVYTGPMTLAFRDVADPIPQPGEHLVRVDTGGICGSDMHAYLGHDARRPAPLILGHEAAGTIMGGSRNGDRVTINPLVTCGTCPACKAGRENLCPNRQIISMPPRDGTFADFVAVPESNLVPVPDNVPLAKAALVEPLAVSWHAVKLGIASLHPAMDRRALVLGGGAIGLASALALHALGIEDVQVVEPNDLRRDYLNRRCGVEARASADQNAPLVIDAVGYASTRETASQLVEPGGVIVHIGLGEDKGGLDIRRMTLQEITFIGTYTYSAADFRETAQVLYEGRLGSLDWIEERPLSEGATAFADLKAGKSAAPKIVLKP